jgi:predicted signal transduction protein with EAL and GGDEF domain
MRRSQDLELEITESVFLRDIEEIVRTLSELKSMGVAISQDNFGTGYSQLSPAPRLLNRHFMFHKNVSDVHRKRYRKSSIDCIRRKPRPITRSRPFGHFSVDVCSDITSVTA